MSDFDVGISRTKWKDLSAEDCDVNGTEAVVVENVESERAVGGFVFVSGGSTAKCRCGSFVWGGEGLSAWDRNV